MVELKIQTALLSLLALALVPAARAENAPAPTELTMAQAVERAKDHSPEIRGLLNQEQSLRAKSRQALAPYEPNLTLTFNDMPKPFQPGTESSTVVQIQEQIGFPGRALLNRSALLSQAHAVEAQFHAMELQIAANTKAAYLQLSLAQQNLKLNDEQREAYQRIQEVAQRRYAAGAISQVDLLNAEVTLYQNSNDLSDLQAAERSSRAQLNVLMGQSPDAPTQVQHFKSALLPLPSYEEAEKRMSENRHEIRAARFQYEASDDAVKLARMSLLPDFIVSAGATQYNVYQASPWVSTGQPGMPTYTYMASIQVMIPIFGLFNEREAISGALHDRTAAEANLKTVVNQSVVQLKSTLETLRALELRLKNNEDHLLPLSEQAFKLALTNYAAGRIDFQTLSDTASSRRNIRKDYLTAAVNYLTNYATLGQLMGEEK